ncbi:MAG: enoyl-CoA hydratase/isomerase family protein [Terriglobales bacterium]|jgi:enoyl-CoA hydratase/carnithine racemase
MASPTITTTYQKVIYERKGAKGEALWLTLNNEAMRNALDDTMQRELLDILEKVALDYSIRCVVIGAAGEKAFCSGGDIRAFQSMNLVSGYEYLLQRGARIHQLITTMEKPVIAAVAGMCFAGGLELALMCDFIYATESATFGLLEINLGLLAGWGGTVRLPRAIPAARAKEMIYRGEVIKAPEAHQWGLVNRVFPSRAEMYQALEKTVEELVAKPPLALRAAKTIINNSATCDSIDAALAIERGTIQWLAGSEDMKEGVAAFVEKRKPSFKGK